MEDEKRGRGGGVITQAVGRSCYDGKFPVCWNLYFSETAFYIRMYLTVNILISDLCKIRLVSVLPESSNYCASRGVPVAMPYEYLFGLYGLRN
jgi:hypothetical protein